MKSLNITIIALLLFTACQKANEHPVINIDQDTVNFMDIAEEKTLEFSTNMPWKATVIDGDWCSVIPQTGNGRFNANNKIYIRCEKNEADKRECTLQIEYGNEKKLVSIKQRNIQIYVPKKVFNIDYKENIVEIDYKEDIPCTISVNPTCADWLSIVPDTKDLKDRKIRVKAETNKSVLREGEIYIENEYTRETIKIVQGFSDIIFNDPTIKHDLLNLLDKNKDGLLSVFEAEEAKELISINGTITKDELLYFPNIEIFNVHSYGEKYETKLDFKELKKLKYLKLCVTSKPIIISKDLPLETIIIERCMSRDIELSGFKTLKYVEIDYLQGYYPGKQTLSLDRCPNIETLILKNGYAENFNIQDLNKIKKLTLYQFESDSIIKGITLKEAEEVDIKYTGTRKLDFEGNTNLKKLSLGYTFIETLNLKTCLNLEDIECFNIRFYELDLSKNKKVENVKYYTYREPGDFRKNTLYLIKDKNYTSVDVNEDDTNIVYIPES